MEIAEILSRWKEFGGLGVAILILAKLGDKAFVWLLEVLNVRMKRSQTREDDLEKTVAAMRVDLNAVKEDVFQLKSALRSNYVVAQRAADGIEKVLRARNLELPTVEFFVDQLRTIQPAEEVLKD